MEEFCKIHCLPTMVVGLLLLIFVVIVVVSYLIF